MRDEVTRVTEEMMDRAHAIIQERKNYLGLLRASLCRYGMLDPDMELHPADPVKGERKWHDQDQQARWEGKSWPMTAETMIGMRRLVQLEAALDAVREEGISGDFAECGVWRGGASIFAASYFMIYHQDRKVWAFDSYEGLPEGRTVADQGSEWHKWNYLFAVDKERVRKNFEAYGVPPGYFSLVEGWFNESLPQWSEAFPGRKLAVLRIDADMWEGTYDALTYLYPHVSHNGLIIVDDYGMMSKCKQAVDEYRAENDITSAMIPIDHTAIVWRKTP